MPVSRKKKQAWLVFSFCLLGLAMFWLWGQVIAQQFGERQIAFLQAYSSVHPYLAMALFSLFAFLSVLLGPLSSAPVVPVAIVLWGKGMTLFLMLIGWVVGAALSYAIGKHAGYPIVIRLLSKKRVDEWMRRVSREATFFLALMFRLALPAETGYVFGLIRYPFWKFFLITLVVEVPTGLGLIFVGDAFVTQNLPLFLSLMVLGLGVLGTAVVVLRDRLALSDE